MTTKPQRRRGIAMARATAPAQPAAPIRTPEPDKPAPRRGRPKKAR